MTPNKLVLSRRAMADISRQARILSTLRGGAFAMAWAEGFLAWLEKIADGGAQLGSEHPTRPGFRTFGYKRQATVLAEFSERELRVVRVYFAGQDWTG